MSTKTIITCIQNILPVFQTNIKHGLKHTHHTVFTNKYTSTLQSNRQQIQDIKRLRNSKFIYNYQSALDYLKNNKNISQNNKLSSGHAHPSGNTNTQDQVILLIGDPHPNLYKQLPNYNIITLQQMCRLFPQKVPLSYRNKNDIKLRQQIQNRLKIKLQKQPHISHYLYTSHDIKMWDQAIQLILDHQPAYNVVQFQKSQSLGSPNGLYKLTMKDFLQASRTSYKLVHHHQLPHVIDFNQNNLHIEWIINKIKQNQNKYKKGGVIIIDEDLINDRESIFRKYPGEIQIERVDENSSLWS